MPKKTDRYILFYICIIQASINLLITNVTVSFFLLSSLQYLKPSKQRHEMGKISIMAKLLPPSLQVFVTYCVVWTLHEMV